MADTVVYVVADDVTLYVKDDTTFYAGDVVTMDDFDSVAEFKGLLAAGKIVAQEPSPPEPEPEKKWDYVSIDEHLDAESPNPLANRAIAKVVADIEAGSAVAISDEELEQMWAD